MPGHAGRAPSAETLSTTDRGGGLLQFSAAGHVMGFQAGGYVVTNGRYALNVDYVGANPVPPSSDTAAGSANKGAPPLEQVTYEDLYDGITMAYESVAGGIARSTWRIEPWADPGAIRMRYNRSIAINPDGSLTVAYETGALTESAPLAWQIRDGVRIAAEVRFESLGPRDVGFALGAYDPSLPLVIDPTLAWNTFLGGTNEDYGYAVAVDGSGNVYVAGYTCAVTWGSPVRPYGGGTYDAFAAKLDAGGNLTWNTFLGGTGDDFGQAVDVDGSGNVYVAGYSGATWGSPVRGYVGGGPGIRDAFATELGPSGTLAWNTFLGGTGDDLGNAVAVDGSGNVYVAGYSGATWGSPVRAYSGGGDAFATKLDTSGNLTWLTFLGGAYGDGGEAVAVDGSGSVYVVGNSPATWGSPVRGFLGTRDAFAAKLGSSGTLTWNTFLGSASSDDGRSVAVDGSGNVYVAGRSNATWGSPVRAYAGAGDAFATKLDTNGNLTWNTFLGGTNGDFGYAVAVDGAGDAYVAGTTLYTTWGSPMRPFAGAYDAFLATLGPGGNLTWSTFLGGTSYDDGFSVAVDGSGNAYVAGRSAATWGSPVRAFSGGPADAFVAKIAADATPTPTSTSTPTASATPTTAPTPGAFLVGGYTQGRLALPDGEGRDAAQASTSRAVPLGILVAALSCVLVLAGIARLTRRRV